MRQFAMYAGFVREALVTQTAGHNMAVFRMSLLRDKKKLKKWGKKGGELEKVFHSVCVCVCVCVCVWFHLFIARCTNY